ncbi:MAG: SRPBCC domain-containing protein [Bauldia litoralis]
MNREATDDAEAALVVRRTIRASPERLFAAWTQPEHLMRWWGPGPVTCPEAEIDLRVGGRYRLANRMPDGRVDWISGVFEVVEPPSRLVYSWRIGASAAAPERVTVRFEPRGEETEVVIHHERIATPEARRTHRQGWEGCLDGLTTFLA